jgi:hypothetical protein
MNNRYINSLILLLLIISLVLVNFNQEEETIEVEQQEEIQVIDTTTSTLEPTTTTSSTTSSTTTIIPASTTTTTSSTTSTTTSTTTTTTSTTTVYTGPFVEYAGFEGTNQTTLDELVKQLPPLLLQIIETNNISIINGCHQYGASLVGRCPYGVWDPSGTSIDGSKNAVWKLSIWISDRAFSAGVSYDVLLHESLHAFTYSTRNCPKNSNTNYRQDARDFFGGEEYLVDALVRYYGGKYNHYRTSGVLNSEEQTYLNDYIITCSA